MITALQYQGEGQFIAPRGHWKRLDRDLVIGETLTWEEVKQRSPESHKHFFAVIKDAWGNLAESYAVEFPSPEHLRKFALIKTGYCTKAQVVCANNKEAVGLCVLMQRMDTYALIEVMGNVVTSWNATSQSVRSMGNKQFQESKERVLTYISQLIGADATKAGMAA